MFIRHQRRKFMLVYTTEDALGNVDYKYTVKHKGK